MKKIAITFLLMLIAFMAGGCPFFMDAAHTRAHKRAINRDMVEIHQFTDRHFWSYDWEDPYN